MGVGCGWVESSTFHNGTARACVSASNCPAFGQFALNRQALRNELQTKVKIFGMRINYYGKIIKKQSEKRSDNASIGPIPPGFSWIM